MNWKIWNKIKLKKYQFPCVDCFVRPICNFSKPCDKLEMNDEKVKEFFMKHKCCPDCGSKEFFEGPSGGMSTNIKCGGYKHWFNAALPFAFERIRTP